MSAMPEIIVEEKIGSGSGSSVYRVRMSTSQKYYALKVVTSDHVSDLTLETKILKALKNSKLFPKYRWSGDFIGKKALMMSLLGPPIPVYIEKESIPTYKIYRLINQVVLALEQLHNIGYVHRDIKPDNICLKYKSKTWIRLVDFGLAKSFYMDGTNQHVAMKRKKNFVGNLGFCSENSFKGYTVSRKDDLEALVYVLIFLIYKELPWTKRKLTMKTYIDMRKDFGQKPPQHIDPDLISLLDYCKSLKFHEKPDYEYFSSVLKRHSTRKPTTKCLENNTEHIKQSPLKKKGKKHNKTKSLTIYNAPTIKANLPEMTNFIKDRRLDFISQFPDSFSI